MLGGGEGQPSAQEAPRALPTPDERESCLCLGPRVTSCWASVGPQWPTALRSGLHEPTAGPMSSSSRIIRARHRPHLCGPRGGMTACCLGEVRGQGTNCSLCAKSLSHVRFFVTPWTVAHQAPLSMGFSSKNTGVGGRALLQGIFPMQGSNPVSYVTCIGRRVLYHWCHLGSPEGLWATPFRVSWNPELCGLAWCLSDSESLSLPLSELLIVWRWDIYTERAGKKYVSVTRYSILGFLFVF